MKRNLLKGLLCIVATLAINTHTSAQSTLMYYWDFNTFSSSVTFSPTSPAVSLDADYAVSGLDTAKAKWIDLPIALSVLTSPTTRYCDDVTPAAGSPDYDTVNTRTIGGSPVPSGNAFRARNPDDSLQLLVFMPTTGYKNLQIMYGCQTSSYGNGDSINVFSYSIDSGSTWVSSGAGLSEWVDSGSLAFRLASVHINDTMAYNNPKFVFRINLVGRNSGSSGNNRFDNVSLDGDPIPGLAVNQLTASTVNYTLYPNPVGNALNITSSADGSKSVTITNMVGQVAFTGAENGAHFTVNTANLNPGIYFIAIRDNNSGSVKTMKFVKQ